MPKKIFLQCRTQVNRDAVRRETVEGVEHIIVSGYTLPDNVVMNGGLYPADEIDASYQTLERTLAPVEHPTDGDGNFLPASDPSAIHNFYAGAFNQNVHKVDGRIAVDKVINVQEARKSDRGRRLLDRIEELETNDNARPVHTSTGVFLEVEETDGIKTNAAGDEYTWIARNMVFDHDAILLDSVGAAQPHQGVGMGLNRDGGDVAVQTVALTANGDMVTVEKGTGADDLSHSAIQKALEDAIRQPPLRGDWVDEVFSDHVIFWSDEVLFSAPYVMDGDRAQIVGIPVPVDRDISYTPKTNKGGDMREIMLKALADAGVTVNAEISDGDLLTKYNDLQKADGGADADAGTGGQADAATVADAVANAIKPLTDKVTALETQLNSADTAKHESNAELVGNSDKYPGVTVEDAKQMPAEVLAKMAANCQSAHGVPLVVANGGGDNDYEMPE